MVSENFRKMVGKLTKIPVLILVVVEDGLRAYSLNNLWSGVLPVLILVLMEDGLRVDKFSRLK